MTTSMSSPPNRARLRRARSLLLDLLFPPRCAGCGQRGDWLCATCLAAVPPLGAPLRQDDTRALDWLGAGYVFSGAIRRAIHRFKYERERARADHLGALLVPLLRHLPPAAAAPLRLLDLELDPLHRAVTRGGRPISLTNREFALLELLLRHAGRVVPKTRIAEKVWEVDYDMGSNVIEVHISQLRRKLDRAFPDQPPLLETVIGHGYRLRS